MKTIIVYKSYHRMNTEKVAKAMAEAMNAQLAKVEDVRPEELAAYDLIGLGSGIYGLKHHKALIELIEGMPAMDKNVFIFSTSGNFREVNHKLIKEKLTEKGGHIVGEFTCFGEFAGALRLNRDWKGALAFIGGKNKGHPDEKGSGECPGVCEGGFECIGGCRVPASVNALRAMPEGGSLTVSAFASDVPSL